MLRLTLHKKVLLAFLAIALLPLGLLALYSAHSLRSLADYLSDSATTALDNQASHALELQAQTVADRVADFLESVEGDLGDLARLPVTPEAYLQFAHDHRREIWFRAGSNLSPAELREKFPLYCELAFIDANGLERLRVVAGQVSSELRYVSVPANTTYRSEDYFLRARAMPAGRTYISPVTGWHVDKEQQLRGAASPEDAVEGERYQGVVRFARPLHTSTGVLRGVVVLSLDHRHLMEFTQHLTPTEERQVLFPSYASGNYAFMFDAEGWMISHPKFWDIRGLDATGRPVPAYTEQSSADDVKRGRIPFNLLQAGFVHPNYPLVAKEVLAGRSGVLDVTNVGGARKIMAYAPIRHAGIFGGVTIGAQVDLFHQPASHTSAIIRQDLLHYLGRSLLIATLTAIVALLAATWLARGIADPLLRLIEGTRAMALGNLSTQVRVTTRDEVGELGASFNRMAQELQDRSSRLLSTLEDLRRSRQEILRERDFKETVFENIETGILTLDNRWRVTSVNGPAARLLGLDAKARKIPLSTLLRDWPDLSAALTEVRRQRTTERWSRYVTVDVAGGSRTFRLALLPLAQGGDAGRILTVEDLTERVEIRQRMARMERLVSLGRLSAGIAHEVRNPLTGISLLLDELHDRLLAQPADQGLIRRALAEIERLDGLVNELLSFAALPSGPLSPGNVGAVLGDVLFIYRRQCQHAGVTLTENISTSLPTVLLDADKLKQAIINLLTNAMEAMPQGGELLVSAAAETDGVTIRVHDNGVGIPAERLELIFEPFYTSKGEGTGLGLSITHNIVSDHGGRIAVESVEGEGSTFTLWLPAAGSTGSEPA